MVSGLKGNAYMEKYAELGLKTLEERRKSQDMALVHKFLTEKRESGLFQRMSGQQMYRTRQAAGEHGPCLQYAKRTHENFSLQQGRWNPGTDSQTP
jgi:hypothetical protein